MSTIGDILSGLQSVLLLRSRVDQLDQRITRMGADVEGLAEAVVSLRDRISRLEGVIEGAAMMAARQRRIEE